MATDGLFPIRYYRNVFTGEVGRQTGFAGRQKVCIGGVWSERRLWVEASFAEWEAQHHG